MHGKIRIKKHEHRRGSEENDHTKQIEKVEKTTVSEIIAANISQQSR